MTITILAAYKLNGETTAMRLKPENIAGIYRVQPSVYTELGISGPNFANEYRSISAGLETRADRGALILKGGAPGLVLIPSSPAQVKEILGQFTNKSQDDYAEFNRLLNLLRDSGIAEKDWGEYLTLEKARMSDRAGPLIAYSMDGLQLVKGKGLGAFRLERATDEEITGAKTEPSDQPDSPNTSHPLKNNVVPLRPPEFPVEADQKGMVGPKKRKS